MEKIAIEVAKELYNDQYRINGQSYYDHAVDVKTLLEEVGIKDSVSLTIALLHHAFHLNGNADQILTKYFDKDFISTLRNYKKLNDVEIKNIDPKDLKEEILIKTYFQLAEDPKLLLVRLADKAVNIGSAYALGEDKRREIALKALYIYAPICHLIGSSKFYTMLEDGGFKILHPQKYLEINKYIQKRKQIYIKELQNLQKVLTEIFNSEGISHTIDHRIKSPYSVFKKYNKYLAEGNITAEQYENIEDLGAMRIQVNTVDECYKVEDFLNNLLNLKTSRRDDYISDPKLSGYRSIHNTCEMTKDVEIELQIKTYEMHQKNEFGFASHTFYKLGDDFKKFLQRDPNWLKSLIYSEVVKEKSINYFSDNVYVFTPKGDVLELPNGSTPLDFAYALHEDIGHRFRSAFVNGKIVNKECPLKTGDLVEIKITNLDKMPSRDWIKIVKTPRARRFITRKLNKR